MLLRRGLQGILAASFEHLVGQGQQRKRNGYAEPLRCLCIHSESELARLFNRKVCGRSALENLGDVDAATTVTVRNISSIGHEQSRPRPIDIGAERRLP